MRLSAPISQRHPRPRPRRKRTAQAKPTEREKHTANKPVAAEGTKAVKENKKAGRSHLPAHFGKIGLTAEQRQQMKAVNEKYSGQIKDLEAKISQLKTQREGELHSLLTEAQKKAVEDAKAVAEKLREENKEKRMAAQKALAEKAVRGASISAEYNARYQKLVKEAAAKKKAAQEQAKEAKSKPAPKDSAKKRPRPRPKERLRPKRSPKRNSSRRICRLKRGRNRVPSFVFRRSDPAGEQRGLVARIITG